jgi:hypothetical protein
MTYYYMYIKNRILAAPPNVLDRSVMFEFNDWSSWTDIGTYIDLVHSYGIRTFAATHDNPVTATVDNHMV